MSLVEKSEEIPQETGVPVFIHIKTAILRYQEIKHVTVETDMIDFKTLTIIKLTDGKHITLNGNRCQEIQLAMNAYEERMKDWLLHYRYSPGNVGSQLAQKSFEETAKKRKTSSSLD